MTEKIRYHAPGAAEVWLTWGLDGWQTMPDAARLTETVLKDNKVKQTRMVRKRATFAIVVQVPPRTMVEFSFLIAKTDEGPTVDIRHEREENGRALSRIVSFDGQIEIQPQWKRGPLNVEL